MAASVSTNPGNFANRPTEEVQEIGHKGGLAAHGILEEPPVSSNLGNFANRPTEEARETARKGGLAAAASHPSSTAHIDETNVGSSASRATEEVQVVDIPEVRKTRSSVTTRLDEQMSEGL
ncbi:uncharacterized protein PAC_15729 [Phialocephala subalpina]|uniref:Uncharacterized protein n=1 Tax=Phialocephala subalpina TaxID=576137 RepID=A0A1L7XLA9_9HELO|nr:uncharacterized protein PAC_15729 [Phialocephala subalpina]